MILNKRFFISTSLIFLVNFSLVACASTNNQKENKSAPVYFSNCGAVSLEATDGRNMTREEQIAAEEAALFDTLDENHECNQQALQSGQQAVTAAAGSGNGAERQSGDDGTGQAQGEQGRNGQNASNQTVQQNEEQIISSNSGHAGGQSGVNGQEITVCQISKENLKASTTPEDQRFWQGEVDKNCK